MKRGSPLHGWLGESFVGHDVWGFTIWEAAKRSPAPEIKDSNVVKFLCRCKTGSYTDAILLNKRHQGS